MLLSLRRSFRLGVLTVGLGTLATAGCGGCSRPGTEDPEANGGSSGAGAGSGSSQGASGGGSSGGSGGASASGGGTSAGSSGVPVSSGGGGSNGSQGGSGGPGSSSGTASSGVDAGSPLEQPRELFCMGMGSVIVGGGSAQANTCAGQLAEDTFTFALCACDNISVGSQLTVDAFDSAAGPYGVTLDGGAVNRRNEGHTGINGGPVLLSNKLTALGNLYVAGGNFRTGSDSVVEGTLYVNGSLVAQNNTALTVARNAFVNGDVAAGYTVQGNLTLPAGAANNGSVAGTITRAPIPQQRPCACGEDEKLDIGAITAWAETNNDNAVFADGGVLDPDTFANGAGPGTLRMPCGRYYLSSISHGGALTLIPEGRVVLFVDGNMSTGGLNIQVTADTELDLFVAGDLTVSSAASFGDASAPSRVRTYVGGNLSLQASAEFAGNVYAPNADVSFGAAAEVFGSLFVNRAAFSGSARIHYDSAIRRAGDVCNPPTPDGGMPVDAGAADAAVVVPQDAGTPVDAGSPDAATPVDAGSPDAAVVMPPPDAGTPDAAVGCGGICSTVCGELACLPNMGGTGGTCGACTSDLDCCAPSVCELGLCVVLGG